ncbi:site-specific DNA-methyltransferase, partial [Helicobacter sp. 13S00401-1]|uniref:site-specific DNA-methyltransferase n=1 Tax=Helicobacter sp. 13S00401-1 TaxID=1905758 RepID=UPI00209C6DCD
MQDLKLELFNYLRAQKLYVSNEGEINITKLKDDIRENNPKVLKTLLESNLLKSFFVKVDSIDVFLKDEFLNFLQNKNVLNDSYTLYKNKIGLSTNKDGEVVLNFPFKDCVLLGSATKDNDKHKEIFFNEILAHDDIDRLYDKKAFCNA